MRLGLLVAGLVVAALAALVLVYPAAAAAGCPSCYGFDDDGDGIYVEGSASLEDREAAKAALRQVARVCKLSMNAWTAIHSSCSARPTSAIALQDAARAASPCWTSLSSFRRAVPIRSLRPMNSPPSSFTGESDSRKHCSGQYRCGSTKGLPSSYRSICVISPRVRTRCRSEPDGRCRVRRQLGSRPRRASISTPKPPARSAAGSTLTGAPTGFDALPLGSRRESMPSVWEE